MLWATEQQKKFDVFIVLTDNETWCGNVQPFVALRCACTKFKTQINVYKTISFELSIQKYQSNLLRQKF